MQAVKSHRQLLVMDSDAKTRVLLAESLQSRGFSVEQVGTTDQALAVLEQCRPLAIFAELEGPDADGRILLDRARASDPGIPVIILSDSLAQTDVVDALRGGALDYLPKATSEPATIDAALSRVGEQNELILMNDVYRQELELANRELKDYVRVLERDQKAGLQVQSKLLPSAPANFGEFFVDYRLTPSLYLSGDFIDYGFVSNRYLAFYLTDVSGHGAASAFVTVWLKQLVRRFLRERAVFHSEESFQNDIARLLALINGEVISSKVGCHMTCFVGVLDCETSRLRYSVAGHLPLPILRTPESTYFLSGKGKPLGMFEDAKWETFEIALPKAFSLFTFSDGILEVLGQRPLLEKEEFLLKQVQDAEIGVESVAQQLGLNALETVPDDIAILQVSRGMG